MKNLIVLAASAAVLAAAAPAAAQDYSQSPNFGTVRLSAGFTPDPRTVDVVAGGSIDAGRLGAGCAGHISNAPDVRLNWSGGGSLPLILRTRSGEDTTLVVNGPDGRWYCDDDSGGGLNARVRFNNPAPGQYDIWIGTYGQSPASAVLSFSELQ